jgi:hypothetical protein
VNGFTETVWETILAKNMPNSKCFSVMNQPLESGGLRESNWLSRTSNMTRLSLFGGYVRSEIRYVGVRGQPGPLR